MAGDQPVIVFAEDLKCANPIASFTPGGTPAAPIGTTRSAAGARAVDRQWFAGSGLKVAVDGIEAAVSQWC